MDPRGRALSRIDAIQAAQHRGQITVRTAHHDLSEVVREYVTDVSGVPATTMTVHDLREANLSAVADAVDLTYPPAFDAPGEGDVDATVRVAREVVLRWN